MDDHVVHPVHVKLEFCAGIRVAETELGFDEVVGVEAFEEFVGVLTDAAEDFLGVFGGVAFETCAVRDGVGEGCVVDDELDFGGFLSALGEVELEEGFQLVVQYAWSPPAVS